MDAKRDKIMKKELRDELKKLKENSTPTVKWYPHSAGDTLPPNKASVRGPFGRWLIVQGGEGYEEQVATLNDDAKFAASAMNAVPELIDYVDELEKERDETSERLENQKHISDLLVASRESLKAKNTTLMEALEKIASQAKVYMLNNEEEWEMSANWVELRCRQALEKAGRT